ncbi:UNVERIFIED_CONTAM: Non-structural maintenance of chromosomes element 1 [Siphonaria sp. JEL0065]|nr:Non-structural maintenance of chromosomes element 1 [Siphonaria sp. JEL0065]
MVGVRGKRRIAVDSDDSDDDEQVQTQQTPKQKQKQKQKQKPKLKSKKRRDDESKVDNDNDNDNDNNDNGEQSAAEEEDDATANPFADSFVADKHVPLLVQALLRQHIADDDQIQTFLESALAKHGARHAPEMLKPFLATTNELLSHLDLNIASQAHPTTGKLYYAIVNTNPDDLSQLATTLNPNEIAFFKRLIYLIMTADDDVFCISTTDALRESKVAKLKVTDTEALLDSFVEGGWLELSNGWLSLSLRALMELKTYLREEFEDHVQYCSACKDLVTTYYERCSVGTCPGRLHKFCAGKYFGVNARVCPHDGCGSAWEGITPAPSARRPSGVKKPASNLKRQGTAATIAEEDEEEEEEDDEGTSDADKEGNLDGFVVGDDDDDE